MKAKEIEPKEIARRIEHYYQAFGLGKDPKLKHKLELLRKQQSSRIEIPPGTDERTELQTREEHLWMILSGKILH